MSIRVETYVERELSQLYRTSYEVGYVTLAWAGASCAQVPGDTTLSTAVKA